MHIQQFSIPMLLISISTIIIDFLTSIFQVGQSSFVLGFKQCIFRLLRLFIHSN